MRQHASRGAYGIASHVGVVTGITTPAGSPALRLLDLLRLVLRRLGRRLGRRLQRIPEAANALAESLAELRQTLRPEENHRDDGDEKEMCRLEKLTHGVRSSILNSGLELSLSLQALIRREE